MAVKILTQAEAGSRVTIALTAFCGLNKAGLMLTMGYSTMNLGWLKFTFGFKYFLVIRPKSLHQIDRVLNKDRKCCIPSISFLIVFPLKSHFHHIKSRLLQELVECFTE